MKLTDEMPFGFASMPRWASMLPISAAAKILLHHYAEFASVSQEFTCYATDANVARFLEMSERHVQRAKVELKKSGMITVERGGPGKPAKIYLNWTTVAASAALRALAMGLNVTEMASFERHGCQVLTGHECQVYTDTDGGSILTQMSDKQSNITDRSKQNLPLPAQRETPMSALTQMSDSDVPGPDEDVKPEEWEAWPRKKRSRWGLQFLPGILAVYWEAYESFYGEKPAVNGTALAGLIAKKLEVVPPYNIKAVFRQAFATQDKFVIDIRESPRALLGETVFAKLWREAESGD